MEFSVPQFIEMETKIVGPLTWRQFIFVGGACVAIFFLYFFMKNIFVIFIIVSAVLLISSLGLAFLKIGGHPLPTVLFNFVVYSLSSKIYIWRKESIMKTFVYKKEKIKMKKKEVERGPSLRVADKSLLKDLSTQAELKTK